MRIALTLLVITTLSSLGCTKKLFTDRNEAADEAADEDDDAGTSSSSGTAADAPGSPLGLTTDFAWDSADLSWNAVSGASGYLVLRSTSSISWTPTDGKGYTAGASVTSGVVVVQSAAATSATASGLTPGQTYNFAVFAYNSDKAYSSKLTGSAQPGLKQVDSFGGQFSGIDYENSYLYVSSFGYSGLEIYDISTPTSPSLVGSLGNLDGYQVDVEGNYAYVGSDAGLIVVDVSDPSAPVEVGRDTTMTDIDRELVYFNNHVYHAADTDGLQVWNVADPANPYFLTTYTGGYTGFEDVIADSTYVYTAVDTEFVALNVSNPASISIAGNYDTTENAVSLSVEGTTAWVGTNGNSLHELNITNIGAITSNGSDNGMQTSDFFAYGDRAVGMGGGSNVVFYDISNPNVVTADTTHIDSNAGQGYNGHVKVGNYVYITGLAMGLYIYDVTTQGGETLAAVVPTIMIATDMKASGDFLVVGGYGDVTLAIFDISDPSNVVPRSNYRDVDKVEAVDIVGNYAYISNDNARDCQILDISDKDNIAHEWTSSSSRCNDVEAEGNRWVTADDGDGIRVYDITNPAAVATHDWTYTTGSYEEVGIHNDVVYAFDDTNNVVRIFDVSNLGAVVNHGNVTGLTFCYEIEVLDSKLFCSDVTGIHVFALTDPTTPSLITTITIGATLTGDHNMEFYNNYLIVSGSDALYFVEMSDPADPQVLNYTIPPAISSSQAVALVKDGYVYTSDYRGIRVFSQFPTP